MAIECKYEVKAFPYEWCKGCVFNGCYPWNKNPALLCMALGGLAPALIESEKDVKRKCLNYQLVTFNDWQLHLADLKREAEINEQMRLKAMQGKVYTNNPLPDS